MPRISILAIGSELLDGRTQDTNSSFMAARLAEFGIKPGQFLVCDDVAGEIVGALRYLGSLSDFIIVTGGLGPTTDDVTREAVAEYSGRPLVFSTEEHEFLRAYFEKRNRTLGENHRRQALLPEGAERIPNPVGTASGFILRSSGIVLTVLPGVPAELERMFVDTVENLISEHCGGEILRTTLFRIFGLPESEVGDRIEALHIPEDVFVSYRAMFPEIQVKLKTAGDQHYLDEVAERVRGGVGGERIFSSDLKKDFEVTLRDMFISHGRTAAAAESCTGGMLGQILTGVPGASEYYLGGIVTYSNESKCALLGVDPNLLAAHGAVSGEVASAMAQGAKRAFGSDFAVSITGIAGPEGGSDEKPVGTFFTGLAAPDGVTFRKWFFPYGRERIRRYACFVAMDALRSAVMLLRRDP